jgi:hypothetical protein
MVVALVTMKITVFWRRVILCRFMSNITLLLHIIYQRAKSNPKTSFHLLQEAKCNSRRNRKWFDIDNLILFRTKVG